MNLSEFIEREKTDPDIFWHQGQFEARDLLYEAIAEIARLKAELAGIKEAATAEAIGKVLYNHYADVNHIVGWDWETEKDIMRTSWLMEARAIRKHLGLDGDA